MNQITVAGYIGTAEVKTMPDGKKRQMFTVADSRKRGDTERTHWFTVFSYYSENLSKYLVKGTYVIVSGRLEASIYTSEQTGVSKLNLTLNAQDVTLGPKAASQAQGGPPPTPQAPAGPPPPPAKKYEDEVPFAALIGLGLGSLGWLLDTAAVLS